NAWNERGITYDKNGNVTGDAARGMAIGYNILNLPSWFNDGQSDLMVFYDYLADGTKVALHREETGLGLAWLGDIVFNLQEPVAEPGGPGDESRGANATAKRWRDTTGTYIKVAKNVNLRGPEDEEEDSASYSFESAPYAGGRIEASGTGLTVRKYVTDHLGSVRVIVTDNAVVERSDYYPFGVKHPNSTFPTLSSNRYGFSGKERQNISTGLAPYLDFGARFYDPVIGRWLQQDPMADKYTSFTQYNYCGNDPVNFVDPYGLDWYEKNDNGVIDYVYFDHKLSDGELKNGNYTHLGYTFVKDNTYYSLFGNKVPLKNKEGKLLLNGLLYQRIDKIIIKAYTKGDGEAHEDFYFGMTPKEYLFCYEGKSFKSKYGKESGTFYRAKNNRENNQLHIQQMPQKSKEIKFGPFNSTRWEGFFLILSNNHEYEVLQINFDEENANKFSKAIQNLFP
ncbi:MAG: RHS repeat-associated core domain-containing protein, partial [Bacteroidales bacterium]|nr:RHS repeat-associated core domain-containing protein [Bacteroidales bacterium]